MWLGKGRVNLENMAMNWGIQFGIVDIRDSWTRVMREWDRKRILWQRRLVLLCKGCVHARAEIWVPQ
jgi:hypothetical protein